MIDIKSISDALDKPINQENFKAIKPATDMTVKEAKRFLTDLFDMPTNDIVETQQQGGGYKDLPNVEGKEKHHMPAHSTTDLSYGDGPCVLMDEKDHKQTASYGNSKDAQFYRAEQKDFIDHGKFDKALQMDIDDLREKFGNKYDEGIVQLKEYQKKLAVEGKI